jgi:hypothetical protein
MPGYVVEIRESHYEIDIEQHGECIQSINVER